MDIDGKNYSDINAIVLYQNKLLLRKICKKYNWNFNELKNKLFSK